jgi:YD repeat-containing protein
MKEKGDVTSFLWGYNSYYPVAKLVNASYSQISTALGSAGLQDLQAISPPAITVNTHINTLRNQLSQAMVQGYTYKPMVGVTSTSNERGLSTSFVYDSFNRLSEVKDHNGDIVKFYKYCYRGNDTPYGVAETEAPTSITGLAWLDDPYGAIYPGRFRLNFVNTVTAASYTFDIDANTKRFGGFPWGNYNVTISNLDGLPISGYSLQIWGEEDAGGVLNGVNIDEGWNLLQIFKK